MTIKLLRSLLILVVLGAAFAAVPAQAGKVVLPFKASYAGHFEPAEIDGEPGFLVFAEGQATFLGQFDAEQSHTLGPGPLDFSNGQYIFTGANGNTMYGNYHGTLVLLAEPAGAVEFHGIWTIEGGTGRFEGASGGGTALGVGLSDLSFTLQLEGGIVQSPGRAQPHS